MGEVVIAAHTDNPDPVAAHGIVTYSIVVSNNTVGVTVTNVTVTDTLPATSQFVDITPPAGVTCGGVSVGGTGTLACTGLSLAGAGDPGDSGTFLVRVRTTAQCRAVGTITNSATANDGVNPPFTQAESTTVNAGSDVALTKSASPSPVNAGGVVSYTLTLYNDGPDDASSLVITDTLPPNCVVTGSLPGGCSAAGQTVTCNVADLANGSTTNIGPIRCIAGVAGGSTLTNIANVAVGSASPDNLTDNNTYTIDTLVTAGSDVSVVKTKDLADPVFTGNTFNFVLTPRYSGDFPSGATMTDVVPAQFTINNPSSFSQNGWNCTVSGQTVSCTRIGSGSAGANQALGVVNISVTANTTVASVSNSVTINPPPGVTDPTPGNNTSTLTFQVRPFEADFSSTKTRTVPNAVAQNVPFNFTLAARNNGPAAFTGTVTLTDTLPSGFRLNSYGTASGFSAANCTPAAASLPVDGPVTITCTRNVTNLAANTSAGSIVINVTPTGLGTLTNGLCVSTSGAGPADETPGNNCATNTVESQVNTDQADISVIKTASPPTVPVIAGQLLTYTVEVVNAGPNIAQDVRLVDDLTDLINGTIGAGQGVEAQPTINAGLATIPPSGSATCRIASTGGTSAQLDCTITSLPVCTAGSTCPTFTFGIRPAAGTNPDNNDQPRTNTATAISQVTADPALGNNNGPVTTNVSPRVDMTVTKTDSPDPVPVGQNLTYVITARNNGPSRAYGVSITDTLPDNVTFISATASNSGTCTTMPTANSTTGPGNNTLICSWGTQFNANVQRTVTVIVRPNYVTRGTTLTNSVVVDTTTTESSYSNNTATATTDVSNPAYDLLINKTDSPDPVTVGDDVTYTVVVTNNGASFAENVRIVDTLPPTGLSYRSFSPGTGVSCTTTATVGVIGGTVTCDIAGIAATATRLVQIVLRGETKGTHTNSSMTRFQDATADAFDPQANNSATQPTTVRTRADVQVVSKQAVATGTNSNIVQIDLRRPFDWLISIQNNGPGEADTVTFSDTLPTGMELTGPPVFTVTAGSFTPAAPTCTGTAGSTGFTCAITSMPASGTATVRVPVRVVAFPAGGVITNRATIITTGSFDTNGGNDPNAGNNFNDGTITVLSSSLAGRVYRDNNDNGDVDAGETGISGVTVTVTGTAFDTTIITRTLMTDVNGNFSATGLPEGTYTITETQPPIYYFDGKEKAGTSGGTAPNTGFDATPANNQVTAISLAGNTAATGYLFGEIPAASIAGYVWSDQDNDGVRDAGETTGIPNVQIRLTGTDVNGSVNVTTTTNASGAYIFGPLRAGTYTVTETQPAGWNDGLDRAGSGAGGTAGNDIITGIVLITETVATDYNFGELGGSLAGFVYHDTNNNGVKNTGEQGIQDVTITLTGTDINGNPISQTTTTGIDGSYAFSNLPRPNGSGYTITETQPAGYITGINTVGSLGGSISDDTFLIPQAAFPTGANGTAYNFGELFAVFAQLSGTVWLDPDHNHTLNLGEPRLANWIVELSLNGVAVGSTVTDTNGEYSFTNISPGSGYRVRFREPANGVTFGYPVPNESGHSFTNGHVDPSYNPAGADTTDGTLNSLILGAGNNYVGQSLPVDPSGVVYDSITRLPVSGATVRLTGPGGSDPSPYLVGNAIQVTGTDGYYQFLLLSGAPAGEYTISVTPPAGYIPGPSAIIPPTAGTHVVSGSGVDAIQAQSTAPTGAQPTTYYLTFSMSGASAAVVNNHIPIDPILGGAIITTKTTPLVNVKRGDLVPYTITTTNTLAATIPNIDVRDLMPPGFKYRQGSGTLNGVRTEPLVAGRQLTWRNLTFAPGEKKIFTIILVVGSGVAEGEYTNQAYAANNIVNTAVSNIASATVRVIPDPTFDCADIIGKVFDDKNANGYQDEGEPGIANVRLATARGLIVTTDAEGRFHIPCPQIPHADRGSNFIMKVDDRTLPSGYRLTSENPLVVRLTRGKMTKMNFGATIHRVVRIDVNDAAFVKGGSNLHEEWQQKIQALGMTLHERPTVVRLGYRMGADPKSLVKKRVKAMRETLTSLWKKGKNCPPLVFEEEIVETR